jgi:hypothetical protein
VVRAKEVEHRHLLIAGKTDEGSHDGLERHPDPVYADPVNFCLHRRRRRCAFRHVCA